VGLGVVGGDGALRNEFISILFSSFANTISSSVLSYHIHYYYTLFSHFLPTFPHLQFCILAYNIDLLTIHTYSMLAESIVDKREVRERFTRRLCLITLFLPPPTSKASRFRPPLLLWYRLWDRVFAWSSPRSLYRGSSRGHY
jgi:hypothetical protein